MNRVAFACSLLCLVAATDIASATVTQPNGLVVPLDSMNGEVQLYTLFQQQAEPIDYIADSAVTPDTFSPLCDFTATFLLKESASSLGVGWYNADPNASVAPTLAEIHIIVPAGSPVGTVIQSANIKSDPAYAGGEIGFALIGNQTHYSEQKWNPQCSGCNPPGPWVTALIYPSKVTPNAYYLAFEDGTMGTSPNSFGNDGDYNDYVYFFSGLLCSGGGDPCDTGKPGVCAPGVTQCTAGGIICQQLVAEATETCDGLDNDCDGQPDQGDLCPTDFVCDKGTCVQSCGSGEFTCPPDKVCDGAGFCVDPACLNVSCPSGEVCVAGVCKAPCDDIVCPYPDVCRVGACVDPCAGITCDTGQVCDAGVCRNHCDCAPCAASLLCDSPSGICIDPLCAGVSCPALSHCVMGACVDNCEGAVCPAGQICQSGACADDPSSGQGGASSSSSGIGTGGDDATATTTGAGAGGETAGSGAGGNALEPTDSGGCGCRTPSRGTSGGLASAAALGLLAALGRRRRRRSAARRKVS